MSDAGVDNVKLAAGSRPTAEPAAQDPPLQHAWSELLEEAPYDNSLSTQERKPTWERGHNGNGREGQLELPPVRDMVVEERYSGTVEEVTDGVVYVSLRNENSGEEEFTSFDVSQLSEPAAAKAAPGAAFTWSIGHHDKDDHRIGVSLIEFLEAYRPTRDELQTAREEGAQAETALLAGESRRTSFG
jgi:hypothetical protein